MNNHVISNVNVVTPHGIIHNGNVYVKGGIIECVEAAGAHNRRFGCPVTDGRGRWLIPGIIDIHNDAIEKEIEPRPNALFPLEIALFSLESRLAMHGVTSIYHSLSFIESDSGIRNIKSIVSNVDGISSLKRLGFIRHNIHARYDITENNFCPVLINMIEAGKIQLLSFMDHTPGQGQYKRIEDLEKFMVKHRNMEPDAVKKLIESRKNKSTDARIVDFIDLLSERAKRYGLPMASHDDDSHEKIRIMKKRGITISEFPIDMESAEAASMEGMHIVVGAPNIIRGISNSGNLRAIDAVKRGLAHILCSDYLPSSILHAVFILNYKYNLPLHEAVNMATLNAARAIGVDKELGSVECGKKADLVLVNELEGLPFVESLFVNGIKVLDRGVCHVFGYRQNLDVNSSYIKCEVLH